MDISLSSLNNSPKKNGKYEEILIDKIYNLYKNKRYDIRKHVSFNIAWGNVISEIDLILLNIDEIIIFEIKSKKDKIGKAHKQIENFRKYADYIYVASDIFLDETSFSDEIGLIFINENIEIIKKAKKIIYNIDKKDLNKIKKECLYKLLDLTIRRKKLTKKEIIDLLIKKYNQNQINNFFRKIIFCDRDCSSCNLIK
jgi:Holliday junction resolvase-like predicted endonuclease